MEKEKRRLAGPAIRALVVDDSTVVRRLMEFTLSAVGIEIDFAATGEDALALVRHSRYDIIFLDVLLPGIDGYRVCKAIRAGRLTKDTPVVMLTSKDSAIDKVRGIMAGSNVYLIKPLDRSELMQALEKCVPRSATLSARAERPRGRHV